MTLLLTNRAVLLAKIETTPNEDSLPVQADDAILVEEPSYSVNPLVLQRNFTRNDLGTLPHVIGRKLASISFTTEIRSNGKQTGLTGDEPKLIRLLRACGYKRTLMPTKGTAKGPYAYGAQPVAVSWATSGTGLTGDSEVSFVLRVTTGGASGTAVITVTRDDGTTAAITATSASSMTLGYGCTATPTWTGNLVVGQTWVVNFSPVGIRLDPTSNRAEQETITLKLYLDGTLHVLTGAFGTFSIDARAGEYGKITFTFTGQYYDMTDVAMPSAPVFETTKPSQIQLARLNLQGYRAICAAFTFEQGNEIVPNLDANGSDGYSGMLLVDRAPSGGLDPAADLVANNNFWGDLSAAKQLAFQMRMGTEAGNTVWVKAPSSQYTGLTYQSRDKLRVYDAAMAFSRMSDAGDDDFSFIFA